MPSVPTSLYRYYDTRGVLLYVGVTSRGTSRNGEHNRDKVWWPHVTRQEVDHFPSRDDALAAEAHTIRRWCPPFNTQHNPHATHMSMAYAWLIEQGPLTGARPQSYDLDVFEHPILPNVVLRFPLTASHHAPELAGQSSRIAGSGVRGAPVVRVEWFGAFLIAVAGPQRHNMHVAAATARLSGGSGHPVTLRSIQVVMPTI